MVAPAPVLHETTDEGMKTEIEEAIKGGSNNIAPPPSLSLCMFKTAAACTFSRRQLTAAPSAAPALYCAACSR